MSTKATKNTKVRGIKNLIHAIEKMGLEQVELRKNARSAVNSFYDPSTGKVYTTFESGLIQHERPGTEQNLHGHLNKIKTVRKSKNAEPTKEIVKEMSEAGRLGRLFEYLERTKARGTKPIAAAERKALIAQGYKVND